MYEGIIFRNDEHLLEFHILNTLRYSRGWRYTDLEENILEKMKELPFTDDCSYEQLKDNIKRKTTELVFNGLIDVRNGCIHTNTTVFNIYEKVNELDINLEL